ncbi:MAG: M81 family metallopeptidase [Rhodobiaceae bacterium]|nr:M81 family metallopeptidase [Rhodobiaceae bacterium]
MVENPRVAIAGVILESNRFAPVAGPHDFESLYVLRGQAILDDARAAAPKMAQEAAAFIRAMDATGPWAPVPVLLAASHPAGLVDQALFDGYCAEIVAGLRAALADGPLDAVYIANHGGMAATVDPDPDGTLVRTVREAVGPDCRIVVTLDLHGNIGDDLVDNADIVVGYRTNPHVDMVERGEEAALSLRLALAGRADPKTAFVRLPLTPASINLLTAAGPYGEIIMTGQRRQAELAGAILNVSIFGGFVFSDTPVNGLAIVVTARSDRKAAQALAVELAEFVWAERERYQRALTSLNDAVTLAVCTDGPPVIFSDSGDNPGGGGTGRTTELLAALYDADAEDVLIGSFYDPPLAQDAHAAGVGGRFRAHFNRHPGEACDVPFEADAEVIALHDGNVTGRLGLFAGRALTLGPSAAIRMNGITAVVISDRCQTADPMFFEMFGLDIGKARTVAVKSRGHFRAGFRPWFAPDQVYEVDTDGLTTPVLTRLDFRGLPRPVFPLDQDTVWSPPDFA